MQLGIHFSYWANDWIADYHYYIEKAARLGFDVLELSCSGLVSRYASEELLLGLREHAAQAGIRLTAGYGPGPMQNLCSGEPEIVKNGIAFYQKTLPMLRFLGITTLSGPLYSCGPCDFSQSADKAVIWKRTQENLLQAAELAKENQITLALEVVNRYEGYLLNTCEEALRFVEETDHPNIQILLDTFHMNIEENNLPGAILQAGKHLKHFHVSEQNRRVPGQGALDWKEIFHALNQIDYNGAIIIEAFVRSSGNIGRKAMLWRDLISNPSEEQLDRDAGASLAFLRQISAS